LVIHRCSLYFEAVSWIEAKCIANAIDYGSGIPFENSLEYDVTRAAPPEENGPATSFVATLLALVPSAAIPTSARRRTRKILIR